MNKKNLILIAEDDASIRTVLSTELENKYDLKLTDNCAQLWNWISDGLGDLIILDVDTEYSAIKKLLFPYTTSFK